MGLMRIVTITRKPMKGGTTNNVLEHHTGALNIDASRVSFQSKDDQSVYKANNSGDRGHEDNRSRDLGFKMGCGHAHGSGRWPTNVVLTHRSACHIIGERKVPTGTAHRETSGGRTIFSETEKKTLPNMSYADADGMETIPDWACAPDCPVRALDEQSGQLTSGTGAVKRASSKDQGGNRSATYGAESRPDGTIIPTYGDTGGASRFFKQFGGDQPD